MLTVEDVTLSSIPAVHLAFDVIRSRIHIFSQLVEAWPECVTVLINHQQPMVCIFNIMNLCQEYFSTLFQKYYRWCQNVRQHVRSGSNLFAVHYPQCENLRTCGVNYLTITISVAVNTKNSGHIDNGKSNKATASEYQENSFCGGREEIGNSTLNLFVIGHHIQRIDQFSYLVTSVSKSKHETKKKLALKAAF